MSKAGRVTVQFDGDRLLAALQAAAKRAVTAAAEELVGDIKETLSEPGTVKVEKKIRHKFKTDSKGRLRHEDGRFVSKTQIAAMAASGGKVVHMKSAPGDPPAVDTGRLRASVTYKVKADAGGATATVGPNTEYARALEFGYAPRNLEPRPYLRPTLRKSQAKLQNIIETELAEALK